VKVTLRGESELLRGEANCGESRGIADFCGWKRIQNGYKTDTKGEGEELNPKWKPTCLPRGRDLNKLMRYSVADFAGQPPWYICREPTAAGRTFTRFSARCSCMASGPWPGLPRQRASSIID